MNELTKPVTARGIEAGDSKDLQLPRTLLIQKTAKLVDEGCKPGTIINTLTKEIINPVFIPLVMFKYWDLYAPEGDKMVYRGRVIDKNDPKLEGRKFYGDAEGKATAVSVIAFISLIDMRPMVVAFSKSSYGAGKKLYTMATMAKRDLFSLKYKLKVVSKTNKHATYFVLDVEPAGETSEPEYIEAESYYRSFSQIKMDKPALDSEAVELRDGAPSDW